MSNIFVGSYENTLSISFTILSVEIGIFIYFLQIEVINTQTLIDSSNYDTNNTNISFFVSVYILSPLQFIYWKYSLIKLKSLGQSQ